MSFDSDNSVDKTLTSSEVKEDLECLKILFKNFYVAQMIYPEIDLIHRVDQEISRSQTTSSKDLMKRIFYLHKDMYDIHLSYELNWEPLKFEPLSKKEVTLSEDLNYDEIYNRSNYLYFRPGSLIHFTAGQKSFIETISNSDKNIVLDVRGNGGGDDVFAFSLAEAVFTKEQIIPQTRLQVTSLFQSIGFSLSLLIFEYDVAESYRKDVAQKVENLSLQELLPFQIQSETKKLVGKRSNPFKSKIVILTDGACASSCETIVEKLSAHPNVQIMGSNTAGALHFSNAMTYMLPHSGIVVKLPTLLHKYENDAPEGIGYKPDVEILNIDLNSIFN